ncbi:MAG: hypothetical protein AB1762_02145 [Gemmatimonadota bacterium]
MQIFSRMLSVAGVLALVPLIASAQPLGKIVITPYAGVYAPVNDIAKANIPDGSFSIAGKAEHKLGFALGATGSYWLTPRYGFEVGGLYAWSDLKTAISSTQQGDFESNETENAGVIFGTAKFMVALFPQTSDFQLRLGAGPAIITRRGSAYKDPDGTVTGKTDFGGAVSLCTKIPLVSGMALRMRAEDYMYQAKLGFKDRVDPADNITFDKKFQHDFVFSVGLQIGLMR